MSLLFILFFNDLKNVSACQFEKDDSMPVVSSNPESNFAKFGGFKNVFAGSLSLILP